MVRRKGTTEHQHKGGRPKISHETEELIVQMANENPRWSYGKIEGELLKLGTRRVHLAGITTNPDSAWVALQGRQMMWKLDEDESSFRFLIRDRDSKFTDMFDNVFESQGFHVIPTPVRAPNANAYAERWVRTVRDECLDP